GKILVGRAKPLFEELLESCPPLYLYFDYVDRAMQFSSQFRLGVFDCLYVALAEEQECKVVTTDKRFRELFADLTISLDALLAPESTPPSHARATGVGTGRTFQRRIGEWREARRARSR